MAAKKTKKKSVAKKKPAPSKTKRPIAKKKASKKPVAKKVAAKKKAPRVVAKAKKAAKAKPVVRAKPAAKAKAVTSAKPAAKKKPAAAVKPVAVKRRDGSGHLDPQYAAKLRELSREGVDESEDRAFFGASRTSDTLAEELGEEVVSAATSGGEDSAEDRMNADVEEEVGGPFVQTTGGTEFADGTDASNPEGADREPFPKT